MLTFEQKIAIIESTFPQLVRKDVSMKRVNYHIEDSVYDKTVVVQHLHPNGNAFVYVDDLPGYEVDARGLVNVRTATEQELIQTIQQSIQLLTTPYEPLDEWWLDEDGNQLHVKEELDAFNIYFDGQLEDSFESMEEAYLYLEDQRCIRKE